MHFVHKISAFPCPGLSVKTFPVCVVLLFLIKHQIIAQIIDDFTDGNFTMNPSWSGTMDHFVVNGSGQLQLNASAAGVSWLSTDFQVSANQNTVWEFYVKQSFAPSGANFGRFYLMSDQADLSGSLNGYFLQFGEAGSSDAIELFRQNGTTLTSVFRSSPGLIANTFALRLRVTRDSNGHWQLLLAFDATDSFVPDAFGTDNVHPEGRFTGIRCTYTITNASRFYYDDFYFLTEEAGDTTPPHVVSVEIRTSRLLRLIFSEPMDSASVSARTMFVVDELSSHPQTIEQQADKRTVIMSFADDFKNGHHHSLSIGGVMDLAGNAIADTTIAFLYFEPYPVAFKDILITEILPDPSPPVGLPEAEYVELYNRSHYPVDLSGWTISDESTSAQLEHFILLPHAYLVLTRASEEFAGSVMDLPLPSLNNSGDILKLRDRHGVVVDSVAFSALWFPDDTKDGGWSLELIDPQNGCAASRNWTVSESASGGTPGVENSVNASLPDNVGPAPLAVIPADSVTVKVIFNEALHKQLPPADYFEIQPQVEVVSVRFGDAALTSIVLDLEAPLTRSQTYRMTMRNLFDCSGNPLQERLSPWEFIIPESASKGDVIINEILFNPMPQGVDFVEVFNRSDKVIDLSHWSLVNPHNNGSAAAQISDNRSIIHPKEYRVFTEDVNILKGEYVAAVEGNLRQNDLPAFNDDEGNVVLANHLGETIDSVLYSAGYHNAFVRDDEGISLERISPYSPGCERSNWRSASEASGFATPGYANSNLRAGAVSEQAVTIDPEVIRPGVASLSFALIKYQLPHGGVMANVKVLDQQGRSIKAVASNALLGAVGFFRWDGDRDDGSAASVGYYVVRFELFGADGTVQVIRKRLAVF